MGKDEIVWRRPDASAPIRFARSEVRRIVVAASKPLPDAAPVVKPASPNPPPGPLRATVKLAGADWLYGDLTSADGQSFTLKTDGKLDFTIPRAAIEWVYFDSHPAATLAFAGEIDDLNPWLQNHPDSRLRGKTVVMNSMYINGQIPATPRLEAVLEVPEDGEEDTDLQLIAPIDQRFQSLVFELRLGSSKFRVLVSSGAMEEGGPRRGRIQPTRFRNLSRLLRRSRQSGACFPQWQTSCGSKAPSAWPGRKTECGPAKRPRNSQLHDSAAGKGKIGIEVESIPTDALGWGRARRRGAAFRRPLERFFRRSQRR